MSERHSAAIELTVRRPAHGRVSVVNCWEAKRCGREPGGSNVGELGTCPAAAKKAGDGCWLVAGTFCGGTVQGTHAEKMVSCMVCDHYRSFSVSHTIKVKAKYKHLMASTRS